MPTLTALARTKATAIWLVLVGATVVAFLLGNDQATANHRATSILIFVLAFMKIRLVGLYFMELSEAPAVLRLIFEGYCVLVFAAVLGMYLAS